MIDTRLGDGALQAAYQAWMRGERGGHLDDGAWQRVIAGDAVSSERDLLFAHIVTCSECTEIWRGLSWLSREAEDQGLIQRRAAARSPFFRSMLIPLAIAATLIVAIGSMMLTRRAAPADNVLRGTAALAPVEGLMLAYTPDGMPTLVWTPVNSATDYEVEIFSAEGEPLWRGDTSAPPMPWPATLARAKGSYRWRVEARGAAETIARSRLTIMELTR